MNPVNPVALKGSPGAPRAADTLRGTSSAADGTIPSADRTLAQARALIGDLFTHRPIIYWTDLLLTLAIGYTAAAVYLSAAPFSLLQVTALLVSGFALFRAGSYVHEITHMNNGEMLGFRVGWNLLCGIPMVMPSHFYENHIDHHKSQHYGTQLDGEYLPLALGPISKILLFFAQVPLLPAYIALRLLLSPISFLHPRLRNWTLVHASSYVINYRHRLTIRPNAPRRAWAALEIACCLRLGVMFGVVLVGMFPWSRLVAMYVLAMFVLGLNYIRNLVAHRYANDGQPMNRAEQLTDSITIGSRGFLTELFFPLSLRYHALHHLFPGIPYHNLGEAHWRLMARLPADSLYHRTVVPGFWAAARELWTSARRHSAAMRNIGAEGTAPSSIPVG